MAIAEAICIHVILQTNWTYRWGAMDGASQGAEYWNERIRITEPFVEAWRLRLQATPSRHGGPMDASAGLRDFLGPLPDMLGISWESVFSFPTAFLSPKEAGCPTNPKTGYSCQACSEEKDASFLQISRVWFWPWLGRFRSDSIRLLLRQVTLHIDYWDQYRIVQWSTMLVWMFLLGQYFVILKASSIFANGYWLSWYCYEYSSCTGHV